MGGDPDDRLLATEGAIERRSIAVTSEYGTWRPPLRRLLARYVSTGCVFIPTLAAACSTAFARASSRTPAGLSTARRRSAESLALQFPGGRSFQAIQRRLLARPRAACSRDPAYRGPVEGASATRTRRALRPAAAATRIRRARPDQRSRARRAASSGPYRLCGRAATRSESPTAARRARARCRRARRRCPRRAPG